ncbi:hypothetical protein CLV56_0489 [Mumia flava]|uniref:Uncharacterized protein n=1 Tax=Mumia flava TaxID=1348852 RepID=A0A0B2BLG0_9ACTN|nr:hypothetical protein [Mumia flava]PJJ56284.1 hypothetical protein CLV56_0489 [Mumia flava]
MIRRICVLACAVALALSLASPASAAKRTVRDERGDAVRSIDFTKVKVANSKNYLRVRVTIPRFRRAKAGTVGASIAVDGRASFLYVGRTRRASDERWTKPRMLNNETGKRVRCAGDRVRFRSNGYVIRVPQRCLRKRGAAVHVEPTTAVRNAIWSSSLTPPDFDSNDRYGRWVAYR